MELRHLRYFKVTAEELNISRAAARLHIAQPPLSRQIKELEAELGVTLFERLPRGLALTTAGEAFEGYCRQLLERLSFSIEATQRLARKGKRRFGIGFVPSAFYSQLPSLVRRLRQIDALELALQEMTSVQQASALHSGRIDIGFGRLWLDDPGLHQQSLLDEPMVVALPHRHPLVGTRPTLERLAEEPLIVYPARPRPSYADLVLGMFHRRGLHIDVLQETNELHTAIALVACEMGITLVPRAVSRLIREDVVYEEIGTAGVSSPLILCLRQGEQHDPTMRGVLEHVSALLELRAPTASATATTRAE